MKIRINKHKGIIASLEGGGTMVQVGDLIETIEEKEAGLEATQENIVNLSQQIGQENMRSKSIAKMNYQEGQTFEILQKVIVP